MYPIPPPDVKTGRPSRPIAMYTATEIAPSFLPRISPAKVVNKNCKVNGTAGTGILIKAPTAIKAENKAHRIRDLVFNVFLFVNGNLSYADFM